MQYFRCLREVPLLCGRRNIFDAFEKFPVTLRKVACDPSSFLCARPVQYFRCLREVPRDPTYYLRSFCEASAIFSMPPRSSCVTRTQGSLVTPPFFFGGRCQEVPRDTALRKVACDPTSLLIISQPRDPNYRLGRVTSD